MDQEKDRKVLITLGALFEGVPVKLFGYECRLSDEGGLAIPFTKSDGEVVWHELPCDLKSFIRECWNLPDDYIFELASALTLTKLKREERSKTDQF